MTYTYTHHFPCSGWMLGSFILLYAVLTLYGAYLMYTDVVEYQCDPSGAVDVMDTCRNSGPAGTYLELGIILPPDLMFVTFT